jgi:FAD/FMN-containing dehydrogenase
MPQYMAHLYEYDQKQQLLRLQAGASADTVQNAMALTGSYVKIFGDNRRTTLGGAIGEGIGARLSDNYEAVRDSINKLEVILADGEVLQTGPLSRRELNKKKGIQGAEGEIYRGIDAVLDDYKEVIDELKNRPYRSMAGYPGIVDVMRGNTFDLAPLFVGSQGSLGVVVEAIIKTEFRPAHYNYAIAMFSNGDAARDALDVLRKLSPEFVDYMDAAVIETMIAQDVKFDWYDKARGELQQISHVIAFGWAGFNDRSIERPMKRAVKLLAKQSCFVYEPQNNSDDGRNVLRDILSQARYANGHVNEIAPEIVSGFFVPSSRFEDFSMELTALAGKLHIDLPLYGDAMAQVYTVLPPLSLQKVGDKQKILKIIDGLMKLVEKHDGVYYARGGEGRLTSVFTRQLLGEKEREMYEAIKRVFDSHGVLNPAVKSGIEIKDLIGQFVSDNHIRPDVI